MKLTEHGQEKELEQEKIQELIAHCNFKQNEIIFKS